MSAGGPLGYDVDYPRALLAALGVVVVLGVVVGASTSGAAFGAYNARWDGATQLRSAASGTGAEATILRNASRYGSVEADGSVAVVLSPDRAYGPDDRADLRRFVRDGGTLVVAEDVGPHGNRLLAAVGATARFDGGPLRDEKHNYRSPAFPVATSVPTNHSLTANVSRLTLNRGTVLEPGNATVLVRSSGFAYVDRNGNDNPDDAEILREWPVATVEPVGDGRVVAVSDPSLFINAMLDRPDNRRFAQNLFGAGERVYLDYSHTAAIPPFQAVILTLRRTPLLQALVGLAGLGLLAALGRGALREGVRQRVGRGDEPAPSGASADDLAAYLRARHPEWEEARVRRVVRAARPDDAPDPGRADGSGRRKEF